MTLPTSGQISMKDILDEKTGHPAIPQAAENVSLRGLSSDSYNDFTYTGGAAENIAGTPNPDSPYGIAEFHDYTGFDLSLPYGANSTIISSGSIWSQDDEDSNGGTAAAGTQIQLTFTTTPSSGTYFNTITASDYAIGVSPSYTFQTWLFGTKLTGCSKLEARWVCNDMNFDFDYPDSTEDIGWGITPGGSLSSQYGEMRSDTQGDGTNIDYTGSWVEITPSALGGSGSNTINFSLQADASGGNDYDGERSRIFSGSASSYGGVESRINGQNDQIKLIRSPSTGVDIEALSYEYPDFTCIMPDMLVKEQTQGRIRIGDVVVGDRILAKGDLQDDSVADQYVEVTEARTHTRSDSM